MRQTRRRTQAGLTPGKDDNEVWHHFCRSRLKVSMGVQYQCQHFFFAHSTSLLPSAICVPCPDRDVKRTGIRAYAVLDRVFRQGLQRQRRQAELCNGRIEFHDKHLRKLRLLRGKVGAAAVQLRGKGDGTVTTMRKQSAGVNWIF